MIQHFINFTHISFSTPADLIQTSLTATMTLETHTTRYYICKDMKKNAE